MGILQFLFLSSVLVGLSLEQRRGEFVGRSSVLGRSSEASVQRNRDGSNLSTQEAEYVYEYYDEPDYQHYPPKPTHTQHHHHHDHDQPQSPQAILDALQGRSVSVGSSGNLPTPSSDSRVNILAINRERFVPSSSTKRPALLHAQLSRFSPVVSKFTEEKKSTETPIEDEYEYVYEEEVPEIPIRKDVETKVSVSVSASSQSPSSTALPPKVPNPETGIVISVATTKSVSQKLNPTPPSLVRTTTPSPNVTFRRATGTSVVVASLDTKPNPTRSSIEYEKGYPENYPLVTRNASSKSIPSPPETEKVDTVQSGIQKEPPPSSSTTTQQPEGIKFEDVSPFLPPNYRKPLPLQKLLPKIQFAEISQDFLPKDYVMTSSLTTSTTSSTTTTLTTTTTTTTPTTTTTTTPTTTSTTTTSPTTTTTTSTTTPTTRPTTTPPPPPPPKNPIEALMGKIRFEEDISKLLPPGYKEMSSLIPSNYKPQKIQSTTTSSSSTLTPISTTTLPSKLVFPTRPGGFKSIRPTTQEPIKAETPAPPKVNLKQGWPTRKTTEFTGWPTSSTTPTPSTTTVSTTTTLAPITEPTTTTERTTTTLAPPKRSIPTLCELSLCKMEATLRVTGGVRWKPEYADINTEEWKHLESTVKRELDGAYRSSGLAPFYRSIEIEAFNEGSVVVDYFLFLDNVDRQISSEQVRSLFHAALLQGDEPFVEERLRLGRYSIDPRFTDFKVRSIESESIAGEFEEALIPQWGIAVIVIGIASLLFVIIFAVTLMVSKQRKGGKKSGVSLTQEMLSEFNKRSVGGSDSVRREDLYNMEDVWEESHLERTLDLRSGRRSSVSKEGYNIYDSWKTEWNGYNNQQYGDSYARRRSDYDTNF